MLVPTNSDVSPTTRVQIQTGASTVDTGAPGHSAGEVHRRHQSRPAHRRRHGRQRLPRHHAGHAGVSVASIPADTATAGGGDVYRVWIGTFKTENDALIYWGQELQRFPDLLKPLKLVIRQVDLGGKPGHLVSRAGRALRLARGADSLCGAIKSRSPLDECRVILN